jgi:hypothetical protein
MLISESKSKTKDKSSEKRKSQLSGSIIFNKVIFIKTAAT